MSASDEPRSDFLIRLSSIPVLAAIIGPTKVVQLRRWLDPRSRVRILDLGCGNHSVRYFKAAFPHSFYVGVDRELYHTTSQEAALMDSYLRLDLEAQDLGGLPDGSFDLVVLAHLLEHLRNASRDKVG